RHTRFSRDWSSDVCSSDLIATDERVRTRVVVQAIARDGDQTQTAHVGPGLSVGLELLETYPPAETGRRAAQIALTNLRARKAPEIGRAACRERVSERGGAV